MPNRIKIDGSPKVAVSEDSSLNENVFRGTDIQSDTIQYFFFIQDLGINIKLLLKKKLVHKRQEELRIKREAYD